MLVEMIKMKVVMVVIVMVMVMVVSTVPVVPVIHVDFKLCGRPAATFPAPPIDVQLFPCRRAASDWHMAGQGPSPDGGDCPRPCLLVVGLPPT
eukprot:764967-Hanusia_phi.AAC.6